MESAGWPETKDGWLGSVLWRLYRHPIERKANQVETEVE
jgi:hypothetical protein